MPPADRMTGRATNTKEEWIVQVLRESNMPPEGKLVSIAYGLGLGSTSAPVQAEDIARATALPVDTVRSWLSRLEAGTA